MSRKQPKRPAPAILFAALGDETRLALIRDLSAGKPRSIAQLTAGSRLSRQAITKHLRILQRVGLVHNVRAGRESLFELDPRPIAEMNEFLEFVSKKWDVTLGRLKLFVEEQAGSD